MTLGRATLLAIILLPLVSIANAAETVLVRLDRVRPSVTFTGSSLRFSGMNLRQRQEFRGIRVYWSRGSDGLHTWLVEDRDTKVPLANVRAKSLEISGDGLRMNLREVPNRLSLLPAKDGKAEMIAKLDLEDYLRGVLPSEMPQSWPLEALKAQAVAARTFALYRRDLREKARAPYHLESSVMDQVYRAPSDEGSDVKKANVERAVRETRGIILRAGRDSKPFATFFHSDCGGRTEDSRAVWGHGVAGSAVDGSCPFNPSGKWRLQLTGLEVAKRLLKNGARSQVALASAAPLERTASGRIQKLALSWADGSTTQVTGHDFRMAMGADKVKSTNFSITALDAGRFELAGQGFGHGVGLCQHGARHLAVKGKGFADILRHYYPKANLEAM